MSGMEPTLVISIDIARPRPEAQGISVASIGEALVGRLFRLQLPATLATEDFATAQFLEQFLRGVPQAEVAQLVPAELCSAKVSREVFANGFRLQRELAAQQGIELTSLVVETDDLPHGDLLARSGVQAIRTRAGRPANDGLFAVRKSSLEPSGGAQLVRYGLWHLPASVTFGPPAKGISRWFGGSASSAIERGIRQTTLQGGICHLVIDAGVLADRERWSELDEILNLASHSYQNDHLNVVTNAGLIAQLAQRTQSRPAGSILRRAA